MRCHVVRPLRRTVRIFAQIGVALPLEQRFAESAVRLPRQHEVASRRVRRARRGDRGRGFTDLDLAALQRMQKPPQCGFVRLALRDDERCRPGLASPHRCPALIDERAIAEGRIALDPRAAIARRLTQHRPRRVDLIADDIAVSPRTAGPKRRIVPGRVARVISAAGSELLEFERQWRRQTRARRLRQKADPPVVQRVLARRRPLVVRRVRGDAGEAVGDQPPAHRHA